MRSLPLLFLIAGQTLPGQTGVTEGNLTISENVDLVVLHVTVRDKKGGFVSGLQRGAFHIFEDGAPQTIRLFQHEDVPVAVGLIVDNSGSMGRKRTDVTAAALTFARSSNPKDEMFVVNFSERVSLGLPNTETDVLVCALPENGVTNSQGAAKALEWRRPLAKGAALVSATLPKSLALATLRLQRMTSGGDRWRRSGKSLSSPGSGPGPW